MTTRERWIVYPLIFMTLGIALRDKVLPRRYLQANTISCNRLQSKLTESGAILAGGIGCDHLQAKQSECHRFVVNGPAGPVVSAGLDPQGKAGFLELLTSKGQPQVQLFSTDGGGVINLRGFANSVMLLLGHLGQSAGNNIGLFAQAADKSPLITLSPPLRFEKTSQQDTTPEDKTSGKTKQ